MGIEGTPLRSRMPDALGPETAGRFESEASCCPAGSVVRKPLSNTQNIKILGVWISQSQWRHACLQLIHGPPEPGSALLDAECSPTAFTAKTCKKAKGGCLQHQKTAKMQKRAMCPTFPSAIPFGNNLANAKCRPDKKIP